MDENIEKAKGFLKDMKQNEKTVTCKVVVGRKHRQCEMSYDAATESWHITTYSEAGAKNISECYPRFQIISEKEVFENLVKGSPHWGRKVFMNF